MCLILFAVNPDSRYRLIVAANRDELYARPTIPADFWPDAPQILAGKDENMGGTWLGVSRTGRFSAVTNFRGSPAEPAPPRSRGDLPLNFLKAQTLPGDYVDEVSQRGGEYRGFNLLAADGEQVCYYGNRAGDPRRLEPGYYGLSNQVLDCDWPKVVSGRSHLQQLIEAGHPENLTESLFDLLMGKGDGREFSNSFIQGEEYGTRAATVVLITKAGETFFEERNFGVLGSSLKGNQFRFTNAADS